MPTVPRYTQDVQEQALPFVKAPTDAPIEAFGGGASLDKLTSAVSGDLVEASGIAEKAKAAADDTATQAAFNQLTNGTNALKYNTDTSNGQPIGALNTRGETALGSLDTYMPQYDKMATDIQSGLSNDSQKRMFQAIINKQRTDFTGDLEKHTAIQAQQLQTDTFNATIKTTTDDAVQNYQNPGAVDKNIQLQSALIQHNGQQMGMSPEEIQQKTTDTLAQTHTAVIQRMLANGQAEEAKAYYDKVAPQLGAAITPVEKDLEAGLALNKGMQAWSDVQGLKLPDGNPDEAAMQSKVMSDDSMSLKDKEAAWTFVKARAGEAKAQKLQSDQGNERDYMNQLVQGRQAGQPLSQALILANQMGRDDYDKQVKQAAAQKVYAPPDNTDPAAFLPLWNKVQDGQGSKQDIDKAMMDGKINAADYRSLSETYYKYSLEGKAPGTKSAWDGVKVLVDQNISDPTQKAQFMYDMAASTQGKSPDEIVKIAHDKLKKDPSTGFFGIGFTQAPQYQTDAKRLDANSTAWGKLYEDVGQKQTTAIGQAALYSGNKNWGPGNVDSFAAQFGGYDNIKAGTPVNNAIQALGAQNMPATPANINWVLARHPDGKWTK